MVLLADIIVGKEIERSYREFRSPGTRELRKRRVLEDTELLVMEERRRDETAGTSRTEAELQLCALKRLEKMRATPRLLKAFDATAPTSPSAPRRLVNPHVEIAAVLGLGRMRWLVNWLGGRPPGVASTVPAVDGVISTFFEMAWAHGRPEIKGARNFAGNPLKCWAYGHRLQMPKTDAGVGAGLEKLLNAKSPDAAVHVNLALVQQLAAQRSPRGKLLHPDIGRFGVVDGTKIPAAIVQDRPKNKKLADLMRNNLKMVGWVVYKSKSGTYYGACHGYKLVLISDLASTLPLAWTLMPAEGSERRATRQVLAELFRVWPECPMEYLIGDGLYAQEEAFAHELVFRWALHPVFPAPSNGFGRRHAHGANLGVPKCCSGRHDMQLETVSDFWNPARREAAGLKRGEWAPTTGRRKWICPERREVGGKVQRANTYIADDARIYTALPHTGNGNAYWLRRALLLRRNGVESIFASVKHFGVGRHADQRPYWASDYEHWWLLSVCLLMLTARRIVHTTDAYERCQAEASRLGLLDEATVDAPAVGPSREQLARETEVRRFWLEPEAPPDSWPTGDFWDEYRWLTANDELRRAEDLARNARVA